MISIFAIIEQPYWQAMITTIHCFTEPKKGLLGTNTVSWHSNLMLFTDLKLAKNYTLISKQVSVRWQTQSLFHPDVISSAVNVTQKRIKASRISQCPEQQGLTRGRSSFWVRFRLGKSKSLRPLGNKSVCMSDGPRRSCCLRNETEVVQSFMMDHE